MKYLVFSVLVLLVVFTARSQNMTNAKLQAIVQQASDSIYQQAVNYCEFKKMDRRLICITDSISNRMRIISPIAEIQNLSVEQIIASMSANFHAALDVKYAVSKGVMWAVYIHPLKELFKDQIEDAIAQVYNANVNFGTTYQSTPLFFGSPKESKESSNPTNNAKI